MNKTVKQVIKGGVLATAVAGFFMASSAQAGNHEGHNHSHGDKKPASKAVKCMGGNSCKGHSACGVKGGHSCAGHNACKGKGFTKEASKEACEAKGGKVKT